ncbi:diguanylate cyclase [Aureimonas sp. AU20]|uniref:GGDEF domain-containing protein n=1 Tax=Aureimonas sp. AU20 TaxID=1349819 RepID=UPI000786448E|nr:GGDEF domain-containing protein [Aureimonas sp. AU20]
MILLHKTSLLAGSGTLLLLWFRVDRPPAVAMIASAFATLAIGALLAGLGEHNLIPPTLWRDTSIALGVCAYTLLCLGTRRLDRRVGALCWAFLLTPLMLGVGLLTSVFADDVFRALIFHGTSAAGSLFAGLGLLTNRRSEPLPSRMPLAASFLTCAALYGGQMPLLALGLATPDTISIVFAATMMLNFAIAALVVSFVRERREELYRRSSLTDALTGTLNRQGFRVLVPSTIPAGGALALFDLDLFKQINDRYGHPAGDHVLITFARLLERFVGEGEIPARIGGEEFVLYIPPGRTEHALRLAEEIRLALSTQQIRWKGETIIVSTSVGLAISDGAGTASRTALFAQADKALYLAKELGRNRVATASDVAQAGASMDAPPVCTLAA